MIKFIAPEDRIVYGPWETANGTVNGTVNLSDKEKEILALLSEDPAYTYQNLADKLNIGRKAVFGRIKSLKEKGIIERIGSDKNGYWQINE
ncbi:transcriptional regulator [Enterococcus faecium]|uniref:Transcriptional regulator n=2 Tax=Enterococcus faecium TaxID=1352 RepID=A0A679C3B7_ENTFC|nr:Lrp/AsnC family transcriptional regulator [Enterococcus faecium]BBI93319.1 transcriptional regulator [Enterococcus faecium]BCZ37920.1 transcriptional regulator [Enterococcus faecium]BCZ37962.1 transcriptional regulator [Enterococcus faecium]